MKLTSCVVPLLLVFAACGGGGGSNPDAQPPIDAPPPIDAAVAPLFRDPLPSLTDDQVAQQALQLLGAPVDGADRNCNQCHGLTNEHLTTWGTYSANAMSTCLTNLSVDNATDAMTMVNCLRHDPTDPTSDFDPAALGYYASGATLPWFSYLFHLASPSLGDSMYADFLSHSSMPRGTHAKFTQAQFDIVAEWVSRGLPLLDTYVPTMSNASCTPSITDAVATHTATLATTGWQATNKSNGLDMFGCAGAATTRDCLATYADASTTDYGATWEQDFSGGHLRVLTTDSSSAYWTRSSADGRFVAHGGGAETQGDSDIIDLSTGAVIGTAGYYDPGFFPDNSGFAFQGNGAHVCDQRLLTKNPQPTYISYSEPECASSPGTGLYQHMAAALNHGDYWTVSGQFVSDNGGHSTTLTDYPADFSANSSIDLTPLVFSGTTYQDQTTVTKTIPDEGDTVISPSATLLISRVAGAGSVQNGYTMRAMNVTPDGNTFDIDIPVVARYCITGEKPSFSFDERWMVLHHYVTNDDAVDLGFTGPSDPAFQAYKSSGASNIYLVDLATGDKTRITRMNPGQYALYPHFRSDGWIYFLVRSRDQGPEYVVASDAALVASGQ